jgi:U32 family peptidase
MNVNHSIELVAPAGSPAALDAAIGEGADAVYLGLRDFNARMRAKNFSYNQFDAIVDKLHDLGKKVYVTVNTIFEEWEKDRIYPLLKYLDSVKPDAVIVQDLGTVKLLHDNFPGLKITASTQMNISSAKAVNFLSRFGVKRVVLSRELGFEDIRSLRSQTNSELEVFVHGALCVSLSGLCLFSSYFGGKSANRGKCSQACRRIYNADNSVPGYYFSTSDLMLIGHIPELVEAGINSIKIEGRMKSSGYVGTVVRAYRNMIDNWRNDRKSALKESLSILRNDLARNKTEYLFVDGKNSDFINHSSSGEVGVYAGKIKEIKTVRGRQTAVIATDAELEKDDTIRFHSEKDKRRKSVKLEGMKKTDGGISISLPEGFDAGDSVYLIERKEAVKKYPHIIPNSLAKYKNHPGITPAPHLAKRQPDKKETGLMKDGIYVKTNVFGDLYLIFSIKPEKVILEGDPKNIRLLKKHMKDMPFKPEEIIVSLPPFFSVNDEKILEEELSGLSESGIRNFIANNVGQLSMLKKMHANVIAGPFLYTFNRYSVDFLMENGCNFVITPLENNKRNLLNTVEYNPRIFFVTLFAYPELFIIKTDLRNKYNFTYFTDSKNSGFHIFADEDFSKIIPENPFSIADKKSQLEKKGLCKFIVDVSYANINKNYYKTLMRNIQNGSIIETGMRFNWKNGFYREDTAKLPSE